ncbi:MAG: hypothetical protein QXG86_00365 [Candidatus Woesearchaeota archaeon]
MIKFRNKKKSQTEMLGIAIVVIILSIGILILVSNTMKRTRVTEQKREFSEKQMATNILGALLSTSTNCNNDRISTLLIDCGRCAPAGQETTSCRICGGGVEGDIYIEESYVCSYLSTIIENLLNNTLKVWNKKYEFMAYISKENPQIHISYGIEKCIEESQYIQKDFYYLPLYPQTLTVELSLCS